jgi:hypothetical protein
VLQQQSEGQRWQASFVPYLRQRRLIGCLCVAFVCLSQDLTKMINANNESNVASKAQQTGGTLTIVKAPVLAPADQKQKAKQAKAATKS